MSEPDSEIRAVEARIARKLRQYADVPATSACEETPPAYVRRHLAEHAAAAGILSTHIIPDAFLPYIDPARLRAVATDTDIPLLTPIRRVHHLWNWTRPSRNAAAIGLHAALDQDAVVEIGGHWKFSWVRPNRNSVRVAETILTDGVPGALAFARIGSNTDVVIIAVGNALQRWDLATGTPIGEPLFGHAGRIWTVPAWPVPATRGQLRYLFGPGKREEHVDPRVVGAWDGAGPLTILQPPARAGGRYDVRGLAELLEQPVRAGFRPPDTPVWHCSIRNHRSDRVLSDGQWAHIAAEVTAAVGLAAHGDLDAVRWVAVRHGDDHIHIVATLVRQDRRTVWPWQDKRKTQTVCRDLEQRYGLYRVAPPGAGSRRWPSPAELNKTARLDAQATASATRGRRRGGQVVAPREQLRRRVRQVAAIARGEDEFFARLTQAGLLVRLRNGRTRGDVSGYAVGLPGHVTATGNIVWYGGGRLAPDLTLPRLRSRWVANPSPAGGPARLAAMGTVPADVTGRAAQTVRDAAEAMRVAADPVTVSAIAAAVADLMTATARVWESGAGGPISEAADWLDRAAHQPNPQRHPGHVREVGRLRAMARLIGLAGVQSRDRDTAAALRLLHSLTAFAETLADLRRAQDRLDQAQAARTAAGQLASATMPPHATRPAGTFAAGTRHPPAQDRLLGSPRPHRRQQ